jgi:hypothetical protein
VEAAILKGMGVLSGVPDVIAIKSGQVYGLELKAPHGKISEAQSETIRALKAAGAICDVAYDIDQALHTLERWNLLKPNVNARKAA